MLRQLAPNVNRLGEGAFEKSGPDTHVDHVEGPALDELSSSSTSAAGGSRQPPADPYYDGDGCYL